MSFLAALFGSRVRCSDCGRAFKPNLVDDPLPDGGALRRFACPHCGQQYIVAKISAKGVRLIEELNETPLIRQDRIKKLRAQIRHEVTR